MKKNKFHVLDHALVRHHLAGLRNKNTQPEDFRRKIEAVATCIACEIVKDLPTRTITVETPLETTEAQILSSKIVIVSILRAGLGMQEPFVRLLPNVEIGHLGFFRDEETLKPIQYYSKLPDRLDEALVVLMDPMLATGGSLTAAINILKERNARLIRCATILAAPEGLEFVSKHHPDVEIITGALDRGLNHNGFIEPGLGDAGDRFFGTK